MNSIRQIQELNARELEQGISPSASWHVDYRDTAFIYIGGLPTELSEGDVILLFSQYGEPVYLNLVRDRDTGKSRGFCFLKYADQRSTDLAVDNLGGAVVLGRTLRVDHTRYKPREGEKVTDNTHGEDLEMDDDDLNHDDGWPSDRRKEVKRDDRSRSPGRSHRRGRDSPDRDRTRGRHAHGRDGSRDRRRDGSQDRHRDDGRNQDHDRERTRDSRDRHRDRERARDRHRDRDGHRERKNRRDQGSD